MESALSVIRDKIDYTLHRKNQRAACDYSLPHRVDTAWMRLVRVLFVYLYTDFYEYCCLLGNYKIA